ncbi:MAG: hypothetical protein AAF682_22370 [Planctomycetota bacterium]
MHLSLLLPLLVPLQVPASAQEEEGKPWQNLDGVVYQAGDDVITLSDVVRHYEMVRRRSNLQVTTPEERAQALDRSLEALVLLALESQAGEDQEASPVQVDDLIDRFMARQRRDRGLINYVDQLAEQGLSVHRERERQKSGFYTSVFRDQGLSGARPTRDGYVRPGELRQFYRTESQNMAEADQVRFRELLLLADAIGGVEPARELAEELHDRLLGGDDFDAIHAEFGGSYRQTKGRTELLEPRRLPPEVAAFARTADVGDVSEIMPLGSGEDGVRAFRILVLDEEQGVTPAPPFRDAGLQAQIRTRVAEHREDAWLNVARARLQRSAYLWPPPKPEPRGSGAGGARVEGAPGAPEAVPPGR